MFSSIPKEASPNALQINRQSTPTPNRISIPLVGEWICDKHERLLTALILRVFEIGDFLRRIKQKNAFKICPHSCLCVAKLLKVYETAKLNYFPILFFNTLIIVSAKNLLYFTYA